MLRNPDYKGVNIVKENGRDVFRLISGDPNIYEGGWDTPQYMKNAVIKAIEDGYNMYPNRIEGLDNLLIESIIRWEKRINNMNYYANNIIPTQGVAGAIKLVFQHLMKPGDDLVLTDPTYIPYKRIGNKIGKARFFRTIEEDGWIPDIDDLRKKVTTKSCAIVLIHPQNPTGCLYNKKNLKAIIDVAGENGIPLISDEIYGLFTYDHDKFYPLASVAKDVPVITMNSISKHYVATGWRIGHISIYDPNESIINIKEQMKKDQSIAGTIPTPLIYGAMAAFDGSIDHIESMKMKLVERRDLSYKRLNDIPGLSSTKPQAAFFIFPKIDAQDRWKDDLEFTKDLRINARIAVNPGSFYGDIHSANHFRVPYLPGVVPLNRVFDRLEEFMRNKI